MLRSFQGLRSAVSIIAAALVVQYYFAYLTSWSVSAVSEIQPMASEACGSTIYEDGIVSSSSAVDSCGGAVASLKECPVALEKRLAVVIDAGSQGTRIYVYELLYCNQRVYLLEHYHYKQIPGGLSTFINRLDSIERSVIGPLMRFALTKIPPSVWSHVPVTLKATAGLRAMPYAQRELLMDRVADILQKFPLRLFGPKKKAVSVLSGLKEGVWAWTAANFLLRNIGYHASAEKTTASVLDLGGVSAQLVFQLPEQKEQDAVYTKRPDPEQDSEEEQAEGADAPPFYFLQFDGRNYTLFQRSDLGLGLIAARHSTKLKYIVDAIRLDHMPDTTLNNDTMIHVSDFPCLPSNYSEILTASQIRESKAAANFSFNQSVSITGSPDMSASRCLRSIQNLYPQEPGHVSTLYGRYLPTLNASFSLGNLYIFSYFADRILPLSARPKIQYSLTEIDRLAHRVCEAPRFSSCEKSFAYNLAYDRNPYLCFDMTHIFSLLQDGCGLEPASIVNVVEDIDGVKLSWPFGAAMSMLST